MIISTLRNSKNILLIIGCIFLFKNASAFDDEAGVFVTGLSYHIGANEETPAYSDAPRGLDNNGAFVLHPGIGFTVDYLRASTDNHAISLIPLAMYFRDCDDRSTYVFGLGPRYRFQIIEKLSLDVDIFLSLFIAQIWEIEKYVNTWTPFPSIGLSYHWDSLSLGLKTTFSPANGDSSAIGSFNILFTYLYVGIKF